MQCYFRFKRSGGSFSFQLQTSKLVVEKRSEEQLQATTRKPLRMVHQTLISTEALMIEVNRFSGSSFLVTSLGNKVHLFSLSTREWGGQWEWGRTEGGS